MPSPVHSPEIVVEGEGHGEGLVGGRVWRDEWVDDTWLGDAWMYQSMGGE